MTDAADDDGVYGDEETDHAALPVDGEQAGAALQLDCALKHQKCIYRNIDCVPKPNKASFECFWLRYVELQDQWNGPLLFS